MNREKNLTTQTIEEHYTLNNLQKKYDKRGTDIVGYTNKQTSQGDEHIIPSLSDVRKDAPSANKAIEDMSPVYKGGFIRQGKDYKLNQEAVDKIKVFVEEGYSIVSIFADWCGDARKALPVLALLEKEIGKDIPSLCGMKKPPYGSDKLWAVPPSPVEVDTFEVTSSPTILIFNKEGEEVGRIKTKPKMTYTVEQEIVKIIEDSQS
jgi:thiol-disulfide isomerase/thioredoxin